MTRICECYGARVEMAKTKCLSPFLLLWFLHFTNLNSGVFVASRSIFVWLILVWYLLSSAVFVVFSSVVMLGDVVIPSDKLDYFSKLNWFDYSCTVAILIADIVAAINLFRFKKSAVMFFSGGIVINIVLTVYQVMSNYYTIDVFSTGLGFVIPVAVLLYSINLKKSGVLQ
jgi:hypothetical protein